MDFIGTYEGKEITKMQPKLLGCWRREGLIGGGGEKIIMLAINVCTL